MRFGAIDVGTNSIHLIVVEADPYVGTVRTVVKAREMVRLGAGDALQKGRLGKKAIARGTEVIGAFTDEARRAGAQAVRIVATSAVRDAKNRDEFQAAVLARTSIAVEVLSGRDEARLIHLGVSRGYPLDESIVCIADIGGGSTEFILADHYHTYFLQSVPLGSLRVFEQFRVGDSINRGAAQTAIADVIAPLRGELRVENQTPSIVIGTSGTWLGLAALDAAGRGLPFNRSHGYTLTREAVLGWRDRLFSSTIEERRAMPGMSPRRSDIIVAGCAIAAAVVELTGVESVAVCDSALREGIVADFLRQNHDQVKAVGDLRLRRLDAIRDIGRRFGADTMHEAHVAKLALELFDGVAPPGPESIANRDLLIAAAFIHDSGHAINASSHHKHSAYIVRHADLPGWRPRERELIAQIVRYHRRAMPKPTHAEFQALDPASRKTVEFLAALLRIADGLDAGHRSHVQSAGIRKSGSGWTIDVRAEGDVRVELESATQKADLFARVFGSPPQFAVAMPQAERHDDVGAAAVV